MIGKSNWNYQTAISGQLQSVSLSAATSWERSGGSHLCRWSGGRFHHKYNIVECSYNSEFHLHFLQIKLLSSENLGNGSDNDGNLNDLPALARGVQVAFLQFQIYSFHSSIDSFARRISRIFPLYPQYVFIHSCSYFVRRSTRRRRRLPEIPKDKRRKFWLQFQSKILN